MKPARRTGARIAAKGNQRKPPLRGASPVLVCFGRPRMRGRLGGSWSSALASSGRMESNRDGEIRPAGMSCLMRIIASFLVMGT
jgi:hypothetical protein